MLNCITASINEQIGDLVNGIILKQKENLRYDYASDEQLEIDLLVYKSYSLSWQNIKEKRKFDISKRFTSAKTYLRKYFTRGRL